MASLRKECGESNTSQVFREENIPLEQKMKGQSGNTDLNQL